MADMEYENENDRFEDPQYRRRSASPQDANRSARNRSASPNGRTDRTEGADTRMKNTDDEEGAQNTGTNLFVTGIHPRLSEADVIRLFEKYGEVENCSIMLDPHTKESRGFGFVNMATPEQAEAAREGLQGEVIDGRTLSIEKARRSRPRTPTPGKYFGPPKRVAAADTTAMMTVVVDTAVVTAAVMTMATAALATILTVTVAVVVITVMTTATEVLTVTLHQVEMIGMETAAIAVTEVIGVTVTVTGEIAEVTAVVEDITTEMMLEHSLLLVTQIPLLIVSLMSLLGVELTITVGTIDPAPAR
ncbi:TRA2B [Microsporum canis CBS 113480]|uniref:TRA2B n=1 Tax=Arthroderma otae (strain ATCC MYA-4605 / CBS 113480) TaxID=554155 RepID=C5FT20_ARTOC|nr:TRA2B [Microsporum canis CBS 113480]EEQ33023.1 TRA2B [Microsporum canis CBS 113480]